jgi:hypothetical protein
MDADGADADGMKLRFVPSVVMSSDSLEGNPPGSPAVPIVEPPAATYSRGGSTRSPSSRSGEDQEAGAFVSEESFRDIVRPDRARSPDFSSVLADHALYYRSMSSPCKVSRGESASRQCRFRLADRPCAVLRRSTTQATFKTLRVCASTEQLTKRAPFRDSLLRWPAQVRSPSPTDKRMADR